MGNIRALASSIRGERARVLQLGIVVFLWQAAVGVYFLSLVQQYLPQELHTGMAFPGYAMAAYGIAKFAWQTPAGWLADRIGRRRSMMGGMALTVPVLVAMMEVPDSRAFLGCSALLGIAAATMWPAFLAHVGETTPRGRRARTMSLLNVAQMAGIGAGTFAGVMLVDYVTYQSAFWMCIALNVLALLMVMGRFAADEHKPAVAEPVAERVATPRAPGWAPGILMLSVIVLFLTLGTSLHTPMIGAYTQDVLRVKMSYMALLFPAPVAAAAVIMWKFHRHSDRLPRHIPLVVGLFVAAICIFALTLTREPIIVANLVVLAGLAYAISIPAWGAAALDATDAGSRGLWLGLLSAVQGLGVAGGQALGGAIGGMWGPLAPFKIAALLLLVALALIISHQWAHARRQRAAPQPA
jgi:predicted MFS family arabinose efflux permease